MRYIIYYIPLLCLLSACVSSPQPAPKSEVILPEKVSLSPPTIIDKKVESIRISAVGDIFMAGTSAPIMQKRGYDYPFSKTKHLFQDSDVIIGNLEGPLTSRGTANRDKKYVFRSPARHVAPALKAAGFNVVTLANNHTIDYGIIGLNDTIQALNSEKIAYIGAGNNLEEARKPYIFEKSGFKVAFLGYSLTYPEEFWADWNKAGTVFGYEHTIRQDIQRLHGQVDSIVVSFHWGREGTTKLRAYQTHLGRVAIDEGAALVIGHHPHIMQGIERYKHGLILYSLGNYVFGSYSNRSQFGGIANVVLNRKGVVALQLTPIDTNNFRRHFQPIPLTGKRLQSALSAVQQLAQDRHTNLAIKNGQLTLESTD